MGTKEKCRKTDKPKNSFIINMLPLRPSSMPRALACAGSHFPEDGEQVIAFRSGDAAGIGKAAHDVQRAAISHEEYNFEEICAKHRVIPKDVRFLRYAAHKFVDLVETEFNVEEWLAEEKLPATELFPSGGTPDIIGIDGDTAIIPDLKTGRVDSDYVDQMKSYAHLVFEKYPHVKKVIALIFWARDLELQKWTWTRADIGKWLDEVDRRIFQWDGKKYVVGHHCGFCQRSVNCKARAKAMAVGRDLILREASANALVGDDLKKAWMMADMIKRAVGDWKARTKERIVATGPISMGDGKELAVVEQNGKPEIYTAQAAAVLKKDYGFIDEDILACCTLSKGAMEDLIGERSERGQKGSMIKAAIDSLKEAGALVPKTSMVTTVRKMEKKNG